LIHIVKRIVKRRISNVDSIFKGVRISSKILIIMLLCFTFSRVDAQDPAYSHFFADRMQLNPALAGIEGPARISAAYRNQWPNTGSSYITYMASYDRYVSKLHGGLGVSVMNDRQGDGAFNTYNLDVSYAYQFQVNRSVYVSGGLSAGIGQRFFDFSNLQFGDMINPVNGNVSSVSTEYIDGDSRFYPDFSAGGAVFFRNFYGGIAVHHLTRPVVTNINDPNGKLPLKFAAHMGAILPIIERRRGHEIMKISPNFVFIQQQSVQQLNYGIDLIFSGLKAGLWARHDLLLNYGDLIFTAGYSNDRISFRYSYDVKLSNPTIRLPNMGAHELSLVIIYDQEGVRNKRRAIKCPKI